MNTNQAGVAARERPIGVFDSGIGGLTVVSALRALLPNETIYYLGDTARVPYGGRSAATVERYSLEITAHVARGKLQGHRRRLQHRFGPRPRDAGIEHCQSRSIGVIRPGAEAAVAATRNGHIGVIGTRATIKSGAYERAIHALDPGAALGARLSALCSADRRRLAGRRDHGWRRQAISRSRWSRRDRYARARLHALSAAPRGDRGSFSATPCSWSIRRKIVRRAVSRLLEAENLRAAPDGEEGHSRSR